MKNLRNCLLLLLLILGSVLSAASYEDIMASALSSSLTVRSNELTYQNNLLSIQQSELEDEAVWSASVSATPYGSSEKLEEGIMVSTAEVSVQLPDDGETTFTLSSPLYVGYSDGSFSITPGLSASHTFNFNYYDEDVLDRLQTELSRVTTERSYLNALYSFKKTVISAVSSIVTLEEQLESLRYDQAVAVRDLENSLKLGKVTESSISYKQSKLTIDKNASSIASYEKQLENAKGVYLSTVGEEWSGLEEVPLPVFALELGFSGNSETESYRLEARIAEEEALQQDYVVNGKALSLEGSAGYSYCNDDYWTALGSGSGVDSLDLSLGLTYSSRKFSVGATAGVSFDTDDWSASPVVTVFGSWTTDSSKKSDRLELNKLRNEAVIASNDYLDARTEYVNELQELQASISEWEFDYEMLVANEEYLEAMLDYTRQSYELGIATKDELEDAEHELGLARYDRQLLLLEGLDLEYDLAIFAL